MGYKEMLPIKDDGSNQIKAWQYELTLTADSNSDWVFIPDDAQGITCTLSFDDGAGGIPTSGSATGKVQISGDLREQVYDDATNVIRPLDWPLGNITSQATTMDYVRPVTAIRLVKTGGVGRAVLRLRAR